MKPTRIKYIAHENYIKWTTDNVQMLKINLNSFPVDKVVGTFSNPQNFDSLNEDNVFNNVFDFAQDFSGLTKNR